MPGSSLPSIDFARIRSCGQPASQPNAFEELASILIKQGAVEWPDGVRFEKFGNPDGGREGRGILPNGDVWAWQAKYLFEFDSSAAGQVTSSVKRVLDLEPNLKRYFVTLPADRPAGDTNKGGKKQESAFTKWSNKVAEWQGSARERGMEVEFVFIGAHELVTALTQPRHAGRVRYWFASDVLTPEWQRHRQEEAIAKAGPRYSPGLHVDVEAVRALHAVSRADRYVQQWRRLLGQFREARSWPWRVPEDAADALRESLHRCAEALDNADATLAETISALRSVEQLPQAKASMGAALQSLYALDDLLRQHSTAEDGRIVADNSVLSSDVHRATATLQAASELSVSPAMRAASEKFLLLTGRAGAGKTHLLCDVAARRTEEQLPTILLFGQDFDGRPVLQQIGELSQLGGPMDDMLAVLNAASESSGCIGLLMIDALNESERPERWRDDIRVLAAAARRYPHVAIVLSCRSEFLEQVIGDEGIPAVTHPGFAEATGVAIRRFTQEYGLERPTFPVLNPEFGNPLFLKLTCEALQTLGDTRFPFGAAGLDTVCRAFIEAVNKRLAARDRCDYDERDNPVQHVVDKLAMLGSGPFDRARVTRVTQEALPGLRGWSQSLMRGLLSEGVLIELGTERIAFAYQRLGDVTRATAIANKSLEDVQEWLRNLGNDTWRENGTLGALAVILPERHGSELIDLAVGDDQAVSVEFIDGFLESVALRAPASCSPRTARIVEYFLRDDYHAEAAWDLLIRVACIPRHPLNADWLHAHLGAYTMADRDGSWSRWLVGSTDAGQETAVSRLIDWAWPDDPQDRDASPNDVATLALRVLGWLLSTSDLQVRDRATKAIVSIAEQAPAAFADVLARFKGVNDPYVIERLAAAACGVALRTNEANAAQWIASGLLGLAGDEWPLHLLTRDYMRRTFEAARARGWTGPMLSPSLSAWPVLVRSPEERERLTGPPDYVYGSVWHSISGGDFGRYVLEAALREVASDDAKSLHARAEQAIFDRVLELGWEPERFREIDERLAGSRSRQANGTVERIGKKYQWIGLYEVLGRIADNYAVKARWEGTGPQPYSYAEQLIWRDIDPTVLARRPQVQQPGARPWFSPARAGLPEDGTAEYLDDMAGVPDPLKLICVSGPEGSPWLVLASAPGWQQVPEPEEPSSLRSEIWMQIRAYLVPVSGVPALKKWAMGKDWLGRWMPEGPEMYNVLLGAYSADPRWAASGGSIENWDEHHGGPQPVEFTHAASEYNGTGTSRDASASAQTTGHVPAARLAAILELSHGVDFTWSDSSGVAVQDPAVALGGPATMVMRRDLLPRLADVGLTIFWTVLIGKERNASPSAFIFPNEDYRWVNASASYVLNGDRVELVDAIARRYKPGPTVERELDWNPVMSGG